MKKKVLAMVLGMSMLVSMTACGGSKAEDTSSDAADTKTEDTADKTEDEAATDEGAEAASGDTYKIAIVKQMDHGQKRPRHRLFLQLFLIRKQQN